jgi:carotenoid cleavage dioxygenase-like enzyme
MHGAGGPRRERRTLEADPFFCFHHVNAWEAGPDSVVMDCAAMRQGVDFGINFGNLSHLFFQRADWRAELTRLRLDLRSGQARAF